MKKYPKYQILEVDFNGEIMFLPVVKYAWLGSWFYLEKLPGSFPTIFSHQLKKDKINREMCRVNKDTAAELIKKHQEQSVDKHGKIISIHESA